MVKWRVRCFQHRTAAQLYSSRQEVAIFDFPDSPTVGAVYTSGSASYTFDGISWNIATTPTAADYVLKAGDTMTGPLTVTGDNDLRADYRLVVGGSGDKTCIRMPGCEIRKTGEGNIELWTDNGGYSTTWGLKMIVGNPPDIQIRKRITLTDISEGNGYFLGDNWHGVSFSPNNWLELVEFHGVWRFYERQSGTSGGTCHCEIDANGIRDTSTFATAPDIVAEARADAALHRFIRPASDDGAIGESVDLGRLLVHALAEIRQLKTQVAQLRGGRRR